jgi:hypothetical protein
MANNEQVSVELNLKLNPNSVAQINQELTQLVGHPTNNPYRTTPGGRIQDIATGRFVSSATANTYLERVMAASAMGRNGFNAGGNYVPGHDPFGTQRALISPAMAYAQSGTAGADREAEAAMKRMAALRKEQEVQAIAQAKRVNSEIATGIRAEKEAFTSRIKFAEEEAKIKQRLINETAKVRSREHAAAIKQDKERLAEITASAVKAAEIQRAYSGLGTFGKMRVNMAGASPLALAEAGAARPGSPYGRFNNTAFNEINHRTTNVAQLAGISLYGLGAIGAGAYGVKQSFDAAAEMKRSELALTGIVNTYYKFLDAQGKSVSNAENLNRAVQHSHELYQKIAQVAPKALMSTQELADVYTANLGLLASKRGGITSTNKAGYNEDQMLEIISKVSELRGLFGDQAGSLTANLQPFGTGILNRRSARTLQNIGLSPDEWTSTAKSQGPQGLFDLFEKAISKFKPVLDSIANSPEGKMKELDAAFVKMKQTIGVELMPVILPFMERLSSTVTRWVSSGAAKKFGDDVADVLNALGKVATGSINLLSSFKGNLMGVLGEAGIIGVMGFFVKGMLSKAAEANAGVLGLLGAIGLLVTGIYAKWQEAENIGKANEKTAIQDNQALGGNISIADAALAHAAIAIRYPGGTGALEGAKISGRYINITKAYGASAKEAYNLAVQTTLKYNPNAQVESFDAFINRQGGAGRWEQGHLSEFISSITDSVTGGNHAKLLADINADPITKGYHDWQDKLNAFVQDNPDYMQWIKANGGIKTAEVLVRQVNRAMTEVQHGVIGNGIHGTIVLPPPGKTASTWKKEFKPIGDYFNVVGGTDLTAPPKNTGGGGGLNKIETDTSGEILSLGIAQEDLARSREYVDAMPKVTPSDFINHAAASRRLRDKEDVVARMQFEASMAKLGSNFTAFRKGNIVSPIPDNAETRFRISQSDTKNRVEAATLLNSERSRYAANQRTYAKVNLEDVIQANVVAAQGAVGRFGEGRNIYQAQAGFSSAMGDNAGAYAYTQRAFSQQRDQILSEFRQDLMDPRTRAQAQTKWERATALLNIDIQKAAYENTQKVATFNSEMSSAAIQRNISASGLGMSSLDFAGQLRQAAMQNSAEIAKIKAPYINNVMAYIPGTEANTRYQSAMADQATHYAGEQNKIQQSQGAYNVEAFMAANAEGMGQAGPQGKIAGLNYRIWMAQQRIKGANLATPGGQQSAESDQKLIQTIEKQITAIEANTTYLGVLAGKSLEAAKQAAMGSPSSGFVGSMNESFGIQTSQYDSLQGDTLKNFAKSRGLNPAGRTDKQIQSDLQIQDYGSMHRGFQLGAAADAGLGALLGAKKGLTIGSVINAVGDSQTALLNNAIRGIQDPSKTTITKNGVTLPAKMINGGNVGDYGQILASVIGGNLGGDSKSGSQIGGAAGSALGSIIPGLGTVVGGILGTLGGGLIGSLFGKSEDPATAAYRRKIAELLTRIDKSLRPVGDYYRTKVNVYSAASAYIGGRALGAGDRLGAI